MIEFVTIRKLKVELPASLQESLNYISKNQEEIHPPKNCAPFCALQKENPCKYLTYKGLSFFEVVWGYYKI